jgi:hypothetical protein
VQLETKLLTLNRRFHQLRIVSEMSILRYRRDHRQPLCVRRRIVCRLGVSVALSYPVQAFAASASLGRQNAFAHWTVANAV